MHYERAPMNMEDVAEGEHSTPIDAVDYVLNHGLQNDRRARIKQSDAYLDVQRKVNNREDTAHALLLSVNLLSMSVMSSQLSMYRWKVSEAQTVTEATSILQEQVMQATRKGFRVQREAAPPVMTSKYAGSTNLQQIYERKQRELEQERSRATADGRAAGHSAAAGDEHSSRASSSQGSSSVCSVEVYGQSTAKTVKGDLAPAGSITRVVLVDSFTHEPYSDILEHIRYVDREYNLQLVVVLLLYSSDDASEAQGAGMVVSPQHSVTMQEAYDMGYDLVLTHCFDHVVVDFLTSTFVSSAGRWRNDVRAKAAVGNYISLKNVLLGRIDMEALKDMVWNNQIADADMLEAIGNQSLAPYGEAKRYSAVGHSMSREQETVGNLADVTVISNPEDYDDIAANDTGVLPTNLPRFRQRPLTQNGVRTVSNKYVPLERLAIDNDAIGKLMQPLKTGQHLIRRRRQGADPSIDDESAFEYVMVGEDDSLHVGFLTALEGELERLMSELDSKQATVMHLQGELELAQRTIAVLKKHVPSGKTVDDTATTPAGSGLRPGSSSLVNLTKEQQIFILKQRLDDANDHIASMSPTGDHRRSGRGQNGPQGNMAAGMRPGDRGVSSRGRGEGILPQARRIQRQMAMKYHERMERALMEQHDHDGGGVENGLIQLRSLSREMEFADAGVLNLPQLSARELAEQQQAKETVNATIATLQEEILQLHSRDDLNDAAAARSLGVTLQNALDVMTSLRKRVQQLEELRILDRASFERQSNRVWMSISGALGGGTEDQTHGKPAKRRKGRGPNSKQTGEAASMMTGRGNTQSRGNGRVAVPKPEAAEKLVKMEAEYAKQLASLREQYEANTKHECQEAVKALERQYRRDARFRGEEVKQKLINVYLKLRRPRTSEYMEVLAQQVSIAEREAQGALERLNFALQDICETRRGTDDAESRVGSVSIAEVADPQRRHQVELIAKEHACFTLRARQAREAMEALHAALQPGMGDNDKKSLLANRDECLTAVKASERSDDPLEYLHAVAALTEVESKLMQWAELDVETAFSTAPIGGLATMEGTLTLPSDPPTTSEARLKICQADELLMDLLAVYRVACSEALKADSRNVDRRSLRRKGGSRLPLKGVRPRGSGDGAGHDDDGSSVTSEGPHRGDGATSLLTPEAGTDISMAQSQLYEAALENQRYGYVHPDRMIDIDRQAHQCGTDLVETRALYLSHHQELIRLAKLLAMRFPALAPVVQYATHTLEAAITKELHPPGKMHPARQSAIISVPFLIAMDTALSTRIVDYLSGVVLVSRRRARRRHGGLLDGTQMDEADLEEVASLCNREMRHLSASDDQLKAYAKGLSCTPPRMGTGIWTAKKQRRPRRKGEDVQHDGIVLTREVSANEGRMPVGSENISSGESGFNTDEEDDEDQSDEEAIGEQERRLQLHLLNNNAPGRNQGGQWTSTGGEDVYTYATLPFNEAGYMAEDLASLFSRQRRPGARTDVTTAEELYLGMAKSGEVPKDDNEAMMQQLQMELEYLNAMQRDRMEELQMRYQARLRDTGERTKNTYVGPSDAESAAAALREVPDFEVKEGSPAWYGMEAAKRVKDILRRRQKPDQIILGGDPIGGVGVELSRRTAFPRPPPKELRVVQTTQERLRAAHTALPPINITGSPREQLRRGVRSGSSRRYGLDDVGYVEPRDQVSIHAFGSVAGHYQLNCADRHVFTPEELSNRVLEYRQGMSRALSRMHIGDSSLTGPSSQYIPTLANSLQPMTEQRHPPSSSSRQGAQVESTSWVYGVPIDRLEKMISFSAAPPDTVLFIPSHQCSSPVGRAEQSAAQHVPFGSRRAACRQARFGSSFLDGANPYTTPAAVAAQRLNALLRVSMADPTVVSGHTRASRAPRPTAMPVATPPAPASVGSHADSRSHSVLTPPPQ